MDSTSTTSNTSTQPERTTRGLVNWKYLLFVGVILLAVIIAVFLNHQAKPSLTAPSKVSIDHALHSDNQTFNAILPPDLHHNLTVPTSGSNAGNLILGGLGVALAIPVLGYAGYLGYGYLFRLWPAWQRKYGAKRFFGFKPHPIYSLPPNDTLPCAQNFFLQHPADARTGATISIGIWYIPPRGDCPSDLNSINLTDGKFVVLQAGGSGSGDRGAVHYIQRYKALTIMRYHVLTFDYRGNADSTPAEATLGGLANDSRLIFNWILSRGTQRKKIVLWGHSLGTVVQIKLLSTLSPEESPLAAVLEGSTTNLTDFIHARYKNRKKTCCEKLPHSEYFLVDTLQKNPDIGDNSVALLPNVNVPLLILHAPDDCCTPVELALNLYQAARDTQPANVRNKTDIYVFEAKENLNHWYIPYSEEFSFRVQLFINRTRLSSYQEVSV